MEGVNHNPFVFYAARIPSIASERSSAYNLRCEKEKKLRDAEERRERCNWPKSLHFTLLICPEMRAFIKCAIIVLGSTALPNRLSVGKDFEVSSPSTNKPGAKLRVPSLFSRAFCRKLARFTTF